MCTGIRLMAADGSVVHARTLEFSVDTESAVIVVPRGYARQGTTPVGGSREGYTWKTEYASVGANALGLPIIIDGLNEAGLAAGAFYFPGFAGYAPYTASKASKTIAPWELASWILDTCATVEDVKTQIGEIVVAEVVLEAWQFVPPIHWVIHEASGKSIVIEYVRGELNIHDNPLGVITNSPTFDWHMTNLRNYLNYSLFNSPPVALTNVPPGVEPVKLEPFGQGAGMAGIPGDFTGPSRFVRAVAFSQSVLPSETATGQDAVLQAFHILNNFDIPKGAVREEEQGPGITPRDEHGNILAEYTEWTSANDIQAKRFYFRSYENSQIKMVDLAAMALDAADVVTIAPIKSAEVIEPLNP